MQRLRQKEEQTTKQVLRERGGKRGFETFGERREAKGGWWED